MDLDTTIIFCRSNDIIDILSGLFVPSLIIIELFRLEKTLKITKSNHLICMALPDSGELVQFISILLGNIKRFSVLFSWQNGRHTQQNIPHWRICSNPVCAQKMKPSCRPTLTELSHACSVLLSNSPKATGAVPNKLFVPPPHKDTGGQHRGWPQDKPLRQT